MGQEKVVCFLSVVLFSGSAWYSVNQYHHLQAKEAGELSYLNQPIKEKKGLLPQVDLEALLGTAKFSDFQAIERRDLFSRFQPKPLAPVAPQLPVVEVQEKKPEPLPQEEPEEIIPPVLYFYRGTMVIEGEEAYIVEQENPFKTYFLKPGDSRQDLSLLEVGKYGITIQDKQGEIFELPIKKEF